MAETGYIKLQHSKFADRGAKKNIGPDGGKNQTYINLNTKYRLLCVQLFIHFFTSYYS